MKTLTYGTVPSFEEFASAFCDPSIDGFTADGLYEITLPEHGIDQQNFSSAGLLSQHSDFDDVKRFARIGYRDNRVCMAYSAQQLYRLVECLTELSEVDDDADYAEWAGSFASSILSTLAFYGI